MRVALMWLVDAFDFAFLLVCSSVCSLLPKLDKDYLTFLVNLMEVLVCLALFLTHLTPKSWLYEKIVMMCEYY